MTTFKNILFRNWLGLVLFAFALLLLTRQCERSEALENSLAAKFSQNSVYKNAIGSLTTKTQVLTLDNQQFKKLILAKDDTIAKLSKSFSKVKTVVRIETLTKIDTIKQTFSIPIPCSFVREDTEEQEWYSFKYKIDSTGFQITDFKIPNKQIIITGFQRKWFLGKQTYTTEVTNTNPNIKTIKVEAVSVVVPKKWYDSKLVSFGVGFAAGLIVK